MARAHRRSDDVYNARRRFRRQAERLQKQAERAEEGPYRSRLLAQARAAITHAAATYEDSKGPRGAVKRIAEKLDMKLTGHEARKERRDLVREIRASERAKAHAKPDRDAMAREILKTESIGHRFYGGLVQIWDISEETRRYPNRAILGYFGVDSLMDVLEILEAEGIDIYDSDVSEEAYLSQQLRIQLYVLTRRDGRAA